MKLSTPKLHSGNSMTDRSLRQILQKYRVDGVFHTHVSLVHPKGRFNFNRQGLEEFWETHAQVLAEKKDPVFGIAEKPQAYIPVLVDVDIKLKSDGEEEVGERLYNEEQIKCVIGVYQTVLRKIVEGCTDQQLTCLLLEKDMRVETKNGTTFIKHGFHLHFPRLFLRAVDQEVHLIPRVKDMLTELKPFEALVEDSGSLIDKAACKVPWLIYGARKSEESKPYLFTRAYDSEIKEISLAKALRRYQLFNHKEHLIKVKGRELELLPRILSIVPYNRETREIKHGIISPLKEKIKARKAARPRTAYQEKSVKENMIIAKKLVPLLADWRARDRNEWMTIGWALYNISDGGADGLELWCDFSARDEDQYDEGTCIFQWERMTKKRITLGTIRHYASIDNKEEYARFKQEQASRHVRESLSGSHYDIAMILYAEYGDEFVCASMAGKIWFQFVNHKWEQIEEGVFLRQKISDTIVERFSKAGQELFAKLSANPDRDKAEEAMVNARIKQVQKMITNLKSAPYKANVMREAADVFYDKRFREKLDANPYLFAFKNGVYDLKTHKFRPGRPEDFISKCAPVPYLELDEEDEKVQEVYSFLEKIFPDRSVRQYFMDVSSDVFRGGNFQKIVVFWTGDGDNGKSVTQNFFEQLLGPLAIKFNTTVVTGKKAGAGAANADLARAGGGVRWAVLEEPDGDEQVNVGTLKHLSGNDSFYARDLFEKGKDGREITPQFKLVFICLAGDTPTSLASGAALSLHHLRASQSGSSKFPHRVLAWDESVDGLVPAEQTEFMNQGERECVTLTLVDGREITCTPNHRFLTTGGKWVEAQHLDVGTAELKMGIEGVLVDDTFDDLPGWPTDGSAVSEEERSSRFVLQTTRDYDFSSMEERFRAAALMRVLGYTSADGTNNRCLYMGHVADANSVLEDIRLLTGKTPSIHVRSNTYQIALPMELTRELNTLAPAVGRRVNHKTVVPAFLIDPKCPTFLLREYVAAMFGGDGVVPTRGRRGFSMMQLVGARDTEHIPSFVSMLTALRDVLKDRFGVESSVADPKLNQAGTYNVFLRIAKNESMLLFAERVGVRHCCHKAYRLTAVASYLRRCKFINMQNQKVLERARILKEAYAAQNPAPRVLQLTADGVRVGNHTRTVEAALVTGVSRRTILAACKTGAVACGFRWMKQDTPAMIRDEPGCRTWKQAYDTALAEEGNGFGDVIPFRRMKGHYFSMGHDYTGASPSVDEYMKETGLWEFCNQGHGKGKFHYSTPSGDAHLPTYSMRVVGRRDAGVLPVYDIAVDEHSCFVANGAVTHNCNKLPKLKFSDKATWNRVRVIPFESTFCRPSDPAPDSYAEQLRQKRFPMDPNFTQKIPGLLSAFAWVLLEHQRNLKVRIEPEKVKAATAIYRKQNDIYRQFFEEHIVEEKGNIMTLTELYSQFKEWFRESLPNHQIPVRTEVEEYFARLWGEPEKGKKWRGYRIRTLQDEIDAGDAIVLEEKDLVGNEERKTERNKASNEEKKRSTSRKKRGRSNKKKGAKSARISGKRNTASHAIVPPI